MTAARKITATEYDPADNSRRCYDLAGQRFARLLVIGRAPRDAAGKARWDCTCDCGHSVVADGHHLKSGQIKSCGCLQAERRFVHGHASRLAPHPLYYVWASIKDRCLNEASASFSDYGGRGITVCDGWVQGEGELTGFECFLADMGERPSKAHSIDRIDNDAGYSPANCRWATVSEQNSNRRLKATCKNGHDLTLEANVYRLKSKPRTRHCRLCTNDRIERFRSKRRAS